MINKAVFSMGALLAVLAFGGIFVLGQVVAPAPVMVIAARVDLPAGTELADVPDTSLVELPLRGDPGLLQSMMDAATFQRLRDSGGVLVEPIHRYEPIRKAAVVSEVNDAAARLPALQLSDPNLMIVRLGIGETAPEVHEGDLVDLGLAVADLPNGAPVAGVLAAPPVDTSAFFLPPTGGSGPGPWPTPTASPTPTLTPTPGLRAPVAKTIVHAALVTRVVREQPAYAAGADPASVRAEGKITAIDVIVPRPAFELVTMAAAAGKLQVGLLSPLADRTNGPTMGASLGDFVDWFYADRERLAPGSPATPSPTATTTPAASTRIPPTATQQP